MRDILRSRQLAAAVAFALPYLAGAADLGPLGSGVPDAARAAEGATRASNAPALEAQRVIEYGPVKRGETLTRIARIVRHDETTLEQTIVGLHRHNPRAFIHNNMNLLRTGQILQVPEPFIVSSIPQRLAVREIRLQTADWESFQARLAQREAPARTDEAPAGARMNEVARISPAATVSPAAEMSDVASAAAVAPGAAAGHGRSGDPRLQDNAPASAEAPVDARERTSVADVTPQAAAASASSAPAAWLSRAGYLAAAGGVLMLGLLALRRRRASSRSAPLAIEPAWTPSAATLAGAAAAPFASRFGGEPNSAAAEEEPSITPIAPVEAPEAADPILVSAESEAPASTSASPIYNTLGGDARSDRTSVACTSAADAIDSAAAALVKAGAALDPLHPFMGKPAVTETCTPLAA